MATYKYVGAGLTFPSLFDKDGNVLVVANGDVFEGPDGITAEGVSIVENKKNVSTSSTESSEQE